MATAIAAPGRPTRRRLLLVVAGVSCVGVAAAALAFGPTALAREALLDLVLVVLVCASAWGLGEPVRRWLVGDEPRVESILTSAALGLAALAVTFLVFGSALLLSRATVSVVVVAGLASLAWHRRSFARGVAPEVRPRPSAAAIVLVAACAVAAAATLTGALIPETFFDALEYHDALPALFLRLGRIAVFPYSVHSAMPANVDLLFLPLLAWDGAGAVKLMHFALFLGSCGWVGALARREHGTEVGLAAGLLFGTLPGVAVMAGLGAIDLGVTFFSLGAFALITLQPQPRGRRTLVAAGLLAGAAAGAKYSALPVLVVAAGLAAGLRLARSRRVGLAAVEALIVVAAAGVTAGPWYLRNALALGNPLYPLGSSPGTAGAWVYRQLRHDSTPPYPAREAWRLVPDVLGERRSFGGGSEVWPGGLLIGLAVLWGLTRRGNDRALAAACVALAACWAGTVLVLRYLYPALALGSVLAGGMLLARSRGRAVRAVALVLIIIVAAAGTLRQLAVRRTLYGPTLAVLRGAESRQAFLERLVPSAAAARWTREHTDAATTKLLLVGETEAFYFDRNFEPVSGYDRHPLVEWTAAAATVGDLRAALIARGITHLVLNAGELERLDRSYSHLSLDRHGATLLRELLATSTKQFDDGRVSVWSLRWKFPPMSTGS